MLSQSVITPLQLADALTYEAFVALAEELYAQNRTTSDDPHYNTDAILSYTRLNLQRISRLDRTTVLREDLIAAVKGLTSRWLWVVLAESWCGDAAQMLPVINQVAIQSPNIELRILLRDKHPAVMDAHLTNGGRSIPKLICLDTISMTELGTWGPRPQALQKLYSQWQGEQMPFPEMSEKIHSWYAKDRTQQVQAELLDLVLAWQKA